MTGSIIDTDWELGRGGYGNTSNVVPAQRLVFCRAIETSSGWS